MVPGMHLAANERLPCPRSRAIVAVTDPGRPRPPVTHAAPQHGEFRLIGPGGLAIITPAMIAITTMTGLTRARVKPAAAAAGFIRALLSIWSRAG